MLSKIPITEYHKSACILCQDPDTGLVLGVSRKDDPNNFGLPGGKCENDEDFIDCAFRELLEETGYMIFNRHLIGEATFECHHTNPLKPGVLYYCKTFKVEKQNILKIRESMETGVISWISPKKLLEGCFGQYYNMGVFKAAGIKTDA